MSGVVPTPQEVGEARRSAEMALQLTHTYLEKCTQSKVRFELELGEYASLLEILMPVWELCEKQLQVCELILFPYLQTVAEFKNQLSSRLSGTLYQVNQVYEYYWKTMTSLQEAYVFGMPII
jgi:hypothetical protein